MPSGFIQRQVGRLLEQAAEAIEQSDWARVRDRSLSILRLDPDNTDARELLAAVDRDGSPLPLPVSMPTSPAGAALPGESATSSAPTPAPAPARQPTSFVGGRYEVKRFLGEGGKKKVYLAHDVRLNRDIAFALIKTQGLDDEGRARIAREAQAMGKLGDHPNIVSVFDMGMAI